MKKYLFLLFLLGFYIGISFHERTQEVSFNEEEKHINLYKIDFKNNINSNGLIEIFNGYNNIIIKKINENEVKCNDIKICVKEVFDEKDDLFEEKYIASGFSIDSIEFIAYKDEIKYFLNKNNLSAKVIN